MTDIDGMDETPRPNIEPPQFIMPPAPLGSSQSAFDATDKGVEGSEVLRPQIAVQAVSRLLSQEKKKPAQKKFTFITFLLTVLMFFAIGAYFFQDRIVIFYENAGVLKSAPDVHAEGQPSDVIAEPEIATPPASNIARVPIAEGVSEEAILSSLGAPAMTINYTDNTEYNCGLIGADQANLHNYVSGCYTLNYENTITIYYGAATDYDMRYFVLLHEYGHYQQGQEGILDSPQYVVAEAEADADCRSINMGAHSDQVTCTIENWTPEWLKTKYGV